MTRRITRMISLNRDNVMSLTQETEFFTRNTGLAPLKDTMDNCRAAFDDSARKAGCRCRAYTTLLTGCVTTFLETIENAKQTDPELVATFVRYIAKTDDIDTVGVTIFYVRPNESEPTKYMFP